MVVNVLPIGAVVKAALTLSRIQKRSVVSINRLPQSLGIEL